MASKELQNIIKEILIAVKKQRNIFSCGNGGSASTAEHLSCDFSKQANTDTNLNIKVFSLNSNVSLMTAIANDISYDDIFSYQLNRFGKSGDLLLLFSVSGSSKNIVKCAKEAKKKKIKIISFTGFDGGKIKKLSKYNINFSTNNFGIVEDLNMSEVQQLIQVEKEDRIIQLFIGILPEAVYQNVLLISRKHDDLFEWLAQKEDGIDWSNYEYEEEEEN